MESSAGLGVCELTNQSRVGIWEGEGLKKTGAKTERFRWMHTLWQNINIMVI